MRKKPSKRKRQRQFTVADLHEMVKQLGGRLRLEIYPAELEGHMAARRRITADNWELFCAHANENPNVCPCPAICGCRVYSTMCQHKPVRAARQATREDQG